MNTYAEKNFTLMTLIIAAVVNLIAGFVLGFFARPVLADSYNVTIEIQDKEVTSYPDQKPFIDKIAGRTYVPIRFVAENLGAKVDWIEDTRTVSIVKPGTNDKIEMQVGEKTVKMNGMEMASQLDAPARIMLNTKRTVVPLRFISENLGYYVLWDGDNRLVRISDQPFVATKDMTPEQKKRLMAYPTATYAEGTYEITDDHQRIPLAGKPIPVKYPMVEFCKIFTESVRGNQGSPLVPVMTSSEDFGDVVARGIQNVGVLQPNQRFIMDDDLLYKTENGNTWVRGILQTYRPDGSVYEQDMEYALGWGKPFSAPGEPQEGYRYVLMRKITLSKAKRVQ